MITSPFCHRHCSAFMHSQAHNLKAMSTTFSGRSDKVYDMMCKRNQWQQQHTSFARTKVKAQQRAQSGWKVMGYSCSEVRSMFPKTESLGIASLSNTTIHASLDMQATSRHSSSYCTTIGGPRCPDTSDSTSNHATYVTGQSCNITNPMENFILQRL
jgi:hypothetical protein